jgi:ribonucleotide reductase class II
MQAEVKERRMNDDFFEALQRFDNGELQEAGPAGCDSDKCLLPLSKP